MDIKRDNEIYFGFISLAFGILCLIFFPAMVSESNYIGNLLTLKNIQQIPFNTWLYFFFCLSIFIVSYGVFFKKEWTRIFSLIISLVFFLATISTIIKGEPRFSGIFIGGFFLSHAYGGSRYINYNIKSGKEFSRESIRNYIILFIILGLPFLIFNLISYFSK